MSEPESSFTDSNGNSRRRGTIQLTILAAIVGGALYAALRTGVLTDAARARDALQSFRAVRGLPFWFTGVYALTASLGIPPVVMTMAGGAVFGTKLGAAYSWVGGLLGALGGYALTRFLAGEAVRDVLGRHGDRLDDVLARAGFMTLLRLRLNPVVPFNVINFAAGLARVRMKPYIPAAALGILPATVVYAYFADSIIAGATRARERALWHVTIACVILVLLTYAPWLIRRVRRLQPQDTPLEP